MSYQFRSRSAALLSRLSLAQQLFLLVLASALPLLLLSLFMFNLLVANERASIRQTLLANAKTLAGFVDNEIDTHATIASTLARSPALQNGNIEEFRHEAERALEFLPGAWLLVSTPGGDVVLNTLRPAGEALPRHIAPAIIQRGFAERKWQVADLNFSPIAQQWTTFVEVPVFRDGVPLYSIAVTVLPSRFLEMLTTSQFTHGQVAAIIDRNKKFVARVPDNENRIGTLASEGWRGGIARNPTGWVENKTVEGDWSLTGYAQTQHGWTAGIARLDADINEPLRRIFWSTALAAALLMALSLVLAAVTGRHAIRGMTALAAAARQVGEGQIIAPPVPPFAEAATIGATLADVSRELKRRGDLITAHRDRLEIEVAQRTAELTAETRQRQETENTLRQVQKMESIGQLTGGIAHDFNNMLTIVMGNLDTLQRRIKSIDNSTALSKPIEAALQGARNAAKLTHRLLAFSRQQTLEPVSLNLNAVVAGLSDLLARTVGEATKLEVVAGVGLWSTFADLNQIENTLVNLAVNARDAMEEGGKLTIETANTYLDEAYVTRFGDLKAGQYVMLSVSDTGTGIAPDMLERVFEPFYTTKEPGKGTGLGLAMVYGFVKQSQGHVRIYSEPGLGTAVKIYLPRHIEPAVSAHPQGAAVPDDSPARPAIPGETILLVEDDPGVREYAVGVLEDLGYRVRAAASGAEGLAIAREPGRIDLLFTDVVLGGGMSGRQLAEQVSELRPTLPVLFTTGYTRNAVVHHGRLDSGVNLLNKPYTQRDLAHKVRALLDAGPPQD
ncbi:ATP-binding protein [Bradyrhizobium sp.]|uniref:ATP-binding protein n=1 Tax=Bradyrhizobium sp. TaxID=376 RepID=UPI0025B874DD|nr:ATP-binding protein [Bradyrhizobium sp.]